MTDSAALIGFQEAINNAGQNCPMIVSAERLDSSDSFGRLFIVVCRDEKYRHEYRVSVNPKGYAFVRPRW